MHATKYAYIHRTDYVQNDKGLRTHFEMVPLRTPGNLGSACPEWFLNSQFPVEKEAGVTSTLPCNKWKERRGSVLFGEERSADERTYSLLERKVERAFGKGSAEFSRGTYKKQGKNERKVL